MSRPVGTTLLWMLASASLVLLVYEAATLIGSVLQPLIANPQALQTDFHYYYEAALRFSGRGPLYSMTDDVIAGFAYPPPAIVPFIWLSKWPLGTALVAFTITSYLVLLASLRQWIAYLKRGGMSVDRNSSVAIMLIALALGPTYMNAVFGQVNAFVLATAVAFVCLAPTRGFEAAVLLALGIWLKIYPIVLAAIALWDRRTWRALAWTVAALAAIGVLTMAIVPLPGFRVVRSRGAAGARRQDRDTHRQSIAGRVCRAVPACAGVVSELDRQRGSHGFAVAAHLQRRFCRARRRIHVAASACRRVECR